jgi:hypothetical protein
LKRAREQYRRAKELDSSWESRKTKINNIILPNMTAAPASTYLM